MFSRDGRVARAAIPFGVQADGVMKRLEGFKTRLKDNRLSFTDSHNNLALIRKHFPDVPIEMPGDDLRKAKRSDSPIGVYEQRQDMLRYKHQDEAFEACKDAEFFGLYMEQGTGKTRVAADKAGRHFALGQITGLLVVTFKGVHRQWAEQQLPEHFGTINGFKMEFDAVIWDKKSIKWKAVPKHKLAVFCMTFSGVSTGIGKQAVEHFCKMHAGALMTVVDESHAIKTYDSIRTENCISIGLVSRFRLAMTGTPIPARLEDEWSQSMFLSESIFGHRFVSTFRSEFVRDSDKDYDPSIDDEPAHVTKFKRKMAPHTFRVTKDEALDLPPKIKEQYTFELNPKARKAYTDLKKNFLVDMAELAHFDAPGDGKELDEHEQNEIIAAIRARRPDAVTVQNAAVLLMRLQQITCGLLVGEKDETTGVAYEEVIGTERLDALAELLTSKCAEDGKIAIWARFTRDLEMINEYIAKNKLGKAVLYHGGIQKFDENRRLFMEDPSVRFFLGNVAKGGAGLNLQGACRTVIYYSNSFNSVDRWQSEDRFHRIGTTHPVRYFDLVAKLTVDNALLKNLQDKASFAEVVLRTLEDS